MDSNNVEYNKGKVNNLVSQFVKAHKGETQETVAAKIGLSKSTLYGLNPTSDTIMKVCSFFGIEPNELFVFHKELKQKKLNSVSAPVEIYEPPSDLASCYKTMFEQQKELAQKDKRIHELELELERVKNANAPGQDALVG